jgi:hypothetical protein
MRGRIKLESAARCNCGFGAFVMPQAGVVDQEELLKFAALEMAAF